MDGPANFGGPLPSFKWLCEELFCKLDKLHAEQNRVSVTEQKRRCIDLFFQQWRGTVGNDIYPAMRLILPHRDRERMYNIKDFYLGKRILELLKVPKGSPTTQKILKWKRGTGERMSEICVEVIKERRTDIKGGTVSITELNELLDKLAAFDCKRSQQMELFNYMFDRMCFLELRYLFDILLKKNIVRSMENSVLYAWHPDAINYLKVVTNLEPLCQKLYDPAVRLSQEELSINIGCPFAPQLAKKLHVSYAKAVQMLQHNFIIEEKMDGERMQMHYENYGASLHYWSRRGTEYTYLYGDTLTTGCISPHLKFIDSVQSIVLDGEMVTYDPQRNVVLPFGVLKGSAIQELQRLNGDIQQSDELTARPMFVVFDILYLNGSSLTNKSLEHRKQFLNAVLKPVPTFVEIIKVMKAHDESMVTKALELAISKGSEGIVIKQLQSKYYVDKRSDFWLKIKPEYLEEFGENVDLVVIGREKSKKDIYYCGLKVEGHLFWCFCRVANGFDQDDYRKIDQLTQGKWRKTSESLPPTSLIEFGKRVPPEWIDPRESFVVEVKARSVDRSISRNYKIDTTLYNAYSRRIRSDKDWQTAATLEEYKAIKDSSRSAGTQNHALNVKHKLLERKRKLESQDEEDWNVDLTSIQSDIFRGLTFMAISDGFYEGVKYTDEEIVTIIRKNGGAVTKNQTLVDPQNLRIIGNKQTAQAVSLREQGYDVLKLSWVFDSLRNKTITTVNPKHCMLVSEKTKKLSEKRVDSLGVGFTSLFSTESLTRLMNGVEVECEVLQELKTIQLFGELKPCILSQDIYDKRFIELNLRAFGASPTALETCNIVVVSDKEHSDSIKAMRLKLASLSEKTESAVFTARVVMANWVFQSIQEGTRADPQDFAVYTARD